MKLSPIQLEAYALLDLSYRANLGHKVDQPTEYGYEDIAVHETCVRTKEDERVWALTLSVRVQPKPESNAPYSISLQLSGLVRALPELKSDDVDSLMRINGASLLYGVAREVVRQTTSLGPFPALLIPSVTFRPSPSGPSITERPTDSSKSVK